MRLLVVLASAVVTETFAPPVRTPLTHVLWSSRSPLESALQTGNADEALGALENLAIDASRAQAAAVLDVCAGSVSASDGGGAASALASEERRLQRCYDALRRRGFASSFGAALESPYPAISGARISIQELERRSGRGIGAFRPGDGLGGSTWVLGSLVSVGEILLSRALGLESPQPLFLATAGLLLIEQVALKGAFSEKLLTTLRPSYAERVVRHEAGHVLVAYLLGCPVQGCVLSAWEASGFGAGGSGAAGLNGAAGTAFFDPELNAAARRGLVARSVIDRYCIVVMGGIAAEAMHYGAAEGGRDDENALVEFLQKTVDFPAEKVLEQARWAVLNAVLLLQDHREDYERLVLSLQKTRAVSIGTCVVAIEDAAPRAPAGTGGL